MARELGTALWISNALGELGEDLAALGERDAGERSLRDAIVAAGEAIQFALPALLALSDLKLAQGLPAEALELAGRAEESAGDYVAWKLHAQQLRAEAWIAQGRSEEALVLLQAVRGAAAVIGLEPVASRAGLDLAALLSDRGRAAEAAGLRDEVRAALESVAADLPEDLRATFTAGPLLSRARGN